MRQRSKSLKFSGWSSSTVELASFQGIEKLASSLTELYIEYATVCSDYGELSKLTNLTTFSCRYSSLSDTSVISSCLLLNNVDLRDNCITGLYGLSNLYYIESLNLTNNCIYDTSTYTNDDGETITYKNLQILADLYNYGALTTLYISGNSGITDYSLITACTNLKTDL